MKCIRTTFTNVNQDNFSNALNDFIPLLYDNFQGDIQDDIQDDIQERGHQYIERDFHAMGDILSKTLEFE